MGGWGTMVLDLLRVDTCSGRRPSSLNFYFQRLPWKLGHCLRRGQRRFWREHLRCNPLWEPQESVNWLLLGPLWGRPAPCSRARKLLPEFLQISFWLPRPKLRRPFSPNSLHCVLMMIQLVVHNARCRVVLKRRSKKPMMRLPSFALLARVSEERYSSELIFRFSKTKNIQLHISGKRTTNHEFVPWKLLSYVLFYQLAFMNLSTCYDAQRFGSSLNPMQFDNKQTMQFEPRVETVPSWWSTEA